MLKRSNGKHRNQKNWHHAQSYLGCHQWQNNFIRATKPPIFPPVTYIRVCLWMKICHKRTGCQDQPWSHGVHGAANISRFQLQLPNHWVGVSCAYAPKKKSCFPETWNKVKSASLKILGYTYIYTRINQKAFKYRIIFLFIQTHHWCSHVFSFYMIYVFLKS